MSQPPRGMEGPWHKYVHGHDDDIADSQRRVGAGRLAEAVSAVVVVRRVAVVGHVGIKLVVAAGQFKTRRGRDGPECVCVCVWGSFETWRCTRRAVVGGAVSEPLPRPQYRVHPTAHPVLTENIASTLATTCPPPPPPSPRLAPLTSEWPPQHSTYP